MALRLAAVFAVLLASLAAHSDGGPVKRGAWHHPCGHSVRADTNAGKHGTRHGFARVLGAVKTQIRVANKYFKNEQKNIDIIYRQVGELKKELYRYDWLPQKQSDWYNKEIRCLNKLAKVEKVLQAFHSSLQNFSVTFEELKKFNRPEIYPQKNARIRERVIGGMAQHLTQVLCEVEWALESLNISIPERVREDLFSQSGKWDPNPDATVSLVQDWGVISLYKKFLGDWHMIIDEISTKKKCPSCKRRKPRKC